MRLTTILFTAAALLCALLFSPEAWAQSAAEDAELATAVAAAKQRYDATFPTHPQLYNGPEYADYSRLYHERIGHQFFLSTDRQRGSVYYNEHLFENLLLSYDIVRDQVIIQLPTNPLTLQLVGEKIRYFQLNGHHFVRLAADTAKGSVLRTGFYEVLQEGPVQLLAKRSKRLVERLQQRQTDVEFLPNDRLFAHKAGTYYLVKSKAAVRRLFADREKEIQAYMQAHNLRLRKDNFEAALAELTHYYNGLAAR